ncbi:MAG: hypothetical protein ABGZ35_03030, partial [Planctomycetaceae bacterium]
PPPEDEHEHDHEAAGDHDPFGADLFDEPDLGMDESVYSAASREELTDDRDPFAPDPQEPTADFSDQDAIAGPVENVSFEDEPESGETADLDLFNFAVDSDGEENGDSIDPFASDEVDVPLPASTQDEFTFDEVATDPTPPDSASNSYPATRSRTAEVNSLIFVPIDNDASTTDNDRRPQSNTSHREPASSASGDIFEADPLESVDDFPDLSRPTRQLRDDPVLRPTPNSPGNAPELYSEEETELPFGAALSVEPDVESDDSMFGADDNGDDQEGALPFFEESSDSSSDLTLGQKRTAPARTNNPVPDNSFAPHDEMDPFDGPGLELPPDETESRGSRFDTMPADSVLPPVEEEPGRFQLLPTQDRADDGEISPQRRRSPGVRGGSNPIEIRPRGLRWSEDEDSKSPPDLRPDQSPQRHSASTGVLRPHLTVQKQMPRSATLGRLLEYKLIVTNEGNSTASDVVVEDTVPTAARVEGVEPPAEYNEETRGLIWEFEELPSGESRELIVQLIPTEQGVLSSVATVRFNAQVTTSTMVQAPKLTLTLTTPRQVRMGAETQLRYVVRNEGNGTAIDVMLRSDLPSGLRHPVGNDLEYNIDSLEPNEEREIVLDVIAAKQGKFTSTAELLAAGVSGETAKATVNIIGQQIQVVRQGPPRRYVGRSAVYSNILSNETAFGASEIRVIERVPKGMKFERASHGGIYNPQQRAVVWTVDEIDAGETKTLKIELVAAEAGEQESSVTVVENAGFETAARHVTAVEDLHNIGTRMSRLDGPVSVGEEFGFDIAVQNRGTTDATGIQLTIDLPDGVQGVSVGKGGPRAEPDIRQGQLQYRFQPVKRIQPGGEMTFRINLKATKPISNGVVNARISYDQMQKELVTSEAITASDD